MRLILILLLAFISVMSTQICCAQPSKDDTVLYLYFDTTKYYKAQYFIKVSGEIRPKLKLTYSFGSYYKLYDGYPLRFAAPLGSKPDTIKAAKLKKMKILTHEQLIDFVRKNYAMNQTSKYFLQLKGIYMVEPDRRKGYVTVTKVELDIDIE